MKNKSLILGIVGFIVFLGVVYLAYNGLASQYKDEGGSNLGSGSTSQGKEEDKVKAPDFTVYDEDMNPVKLSDYEGTPVVLNFWATWCGYCKDEMPYFEEASNTYNEEDVKILMINMTDGRSETKEAAMEYMKSNNYTMKLLLDLEGEVASAYRVSGIPRTIFIDKDGYVKQDIVGRLDKETLNSNIEALINE